MHFRHLSKLPSILTFKDFLHSLKSFCKYFKLATSLNVVNKSTVADLQRSVPKLSLVQVKVVKQVKGGR